MHSRCRNTCALLASLARPLAFVFLFIPRLLCAQGGDEIDRSEAVTTPESKLILQQHEKNVDLYSGAAHIKVPIFQLKQGDIEVPINLEYISNGIRVTDNPTWVGLGWSLNYGGSIIREMRGYEDEKGYGGYLYGTQPVASLYFLDDAVFNSVTETPSPNGNAYMYFLKTRSSYFNTGVDPAPDIFHFSVLGRKGKIMFDGNGTPYSDSNLKIEVTRTTLKITSWTLTFDDGLKCVFNRLEQMQELSSGINSHGNSIDGEPGLTDMVWHLTDIYAPGNHDHIQYQYEQDSHYGETFSRFEKHLVQNVSNAPCSNDNPYLNYNFVSTNSSERDYKVKRIIGSLYEIEFITDTLNYARFRTCLQKINIYAGGTRIRSFGFEYKRYGKRFQLESLRETGSSTNTLPPYHFYYDETPIADYFDFDHSPSYAGVDHWGYYNGSQYNQSQIPCTQISNVSLGDLVPMNRSPNSSYTQAGIIRKFKTPEGGIIEYEFAPNSYSYLADGTRKSTDAIGGGLRVSSIKEKTKESDPGVVINYNYEDDAGRSSGVITNDPYYSFSFNLPGNSYYMQTDGQFWLDTPLESSQIGYKKVKEVRSGGSIVYNFNTKLDYNHPTANEDESFLFVYVISTQTMTFQRLDHPVMNGITDDYPLWGTLKSQQVYDGTGVMLRSEEFNYEYQLIRKFPARKILGIDSWGMGRCQKFPGTLWFFHKFNTYLGKVKMTSNTVTYRNKANALLTENQTFLYSSTNDQVAQITRTLSSGEAYKINYYYASDYDNTNPAIVAQKNQNIRTSLIERQETKNGKVVIHEINTYSGNGKLLATHLRKQSNLPENEIPFNAASPVINSSYIPVLAREYDGNDRLVRNYEVNTNKRTDYAWDETGNYVISELINPTTSSHFHSSFEDETAFNQLGNAVTGERLRVGGLSKTVAGLVPGTYILSYWKFMASQWVLHSEEVQVTGTSYTITVPDVLDEVRFFPKGALLKTYTYKPGIGITSATDYNSESVLYEFDEFGRVKIVRDDGKNILKQIDYHLKAN